MTLSILEEAIFDIEKDVPEYDSIERDVDAMVFALEKAHNEHPVDFQGLANCLKTKGRRCNTKKRCVNGPGNFPRIKVVWPQLLPSAYS